MSGQCTGWVLRHGPKQRSMRAVLLTIADAANRDGEHAHPGLDAIMEGSLYRRSKVLEILKRLVDEGWVEIEQSAAPGRATVYRVVMDRDERVQKMDPSQVRSGADPSEPSTGPRSGGDGSSLTRQQVHSEGRTGPPASGPPTVYPTVLRDGVPNAEEAAGAVARSSVWDAVMSVCGIEGAAITDTAATNYGRAVRSLQRAGATAPEVRRRAGIYRQRWPQASLTPRALANHWAECAEVPRVVDANQAVLARAALRS